MISSALLVLALAACGATPPDEDAAAPVPSTSAPSSASADVPDLGIGGTDEPPVEGLPDGVELTPAGTELDLGEDAVVAWQPRQRLIAVAELRVRRVDEVGLDTFAGFDLDQTQRSATPVLVRTRVTNLAVGDLSRRVVPLYALDDQGALIEPTGVPQDFAPCPRPALPGPFGAEQRTTTCQVFLVPSGRTLTALAFIPLQGGDPVTWAVPQEAP